MGINAIPRSHCRPLRIPNLVCSRFTSPSLIYRRNETMLTSVTRDQSSRRLALKAASSHKPKQYPYTACNPSALFSRGFVRILCPVVVVASSPSSEPQLAAHSCFESAGCQNHAQPARLRYADLGSSQPNDHHRALDDLDPPGSISRSTVSRRSCPAQWAVIRIHRGCLASICL